MDFEAGGMPSAELNSAMDPLLRAQGVTKIFFSDGSETRVLDGVNVGLGRSEFLAIKGPSGAGKSTLLHIAAGLDAPSNGSVTFEGRLLHEMSARESATLRRERFGFVFQFFNLVPGLDVRDNIALPLLLGDCSRREATARAAELIEAVGLTHRTHHLAAGLSGGEMQRVAVARAIVARPQIVFADEPTGNLDSHNGEAVLDLLEALCRESGAALMMVTHDDRAADRADRVIVLRDGRRTDGDRNTSATAGGVVSPDADPS